MNYVRRTNSKVVYSLKPTKNYFNVFNKHIDKIGTLPYPLPEKIVSAYTLAFSVLEDIERPERFNDLEVEELKESLESLLGLFKLAVQYGKEVQMIIKRARLLSE